MTPVRPARGEAVGLAAVPGRPGDVQVGPGDAVADELVQEDAGRSACGRRGHRRARRWQSRRPASRGPCGFPAASASATSARPRPCRRPCSSAMQVVVIAHQPGGATAEGDHLPAGEGGDVDDDVGGSSLARAMRVAEHQAAFGVGVEHLDALAAVHRQHIGRAAGAVADGMFSAIASHPVTLIGSLSRAAASTAPSTARRSGHVDLHVLHAGATA